MQTIRTRNTFAAVVRSIPLQIAGLEKLETPTATAVVSMILADADRVIGTIAQDDQPDWLPRELEALKWDEISANVDALRDAYSGRTLADLRADTVATERAVKRLTSASPRAAKVIERNSAAHAAYNAAVAPKSAKRS